MDRVRRFGLVLLLCAVAAPPPASAAVDEQGARAFIADLGQQAIQVLESGGETTGAFRTLFRQGFDIPTIGRFVLGRYWNAATPNQQQEYLQLFEDMVVQTYARRFSEYSGERLVVTGSRPQGDNDVMVFSQIVRPGGGAPPVDVTWRVRDRGGGTFQIVDVLVENVSMGVTQRNEFSSIIQRNGGSIDALLNAMRAQTASLRG